MIEEDSFEVESDENRRDDVNAAAIFPDILNTTFKSEEFKQKIAALEIKNEQDFSDEDYSLLKEAAKSGFATEVFALAVRKNFINSDKDWLWSSIFIQCVTAEQSLAMKFCDLFKNAEFKKIYVFEAVFHHCIFQGAIEEVFNLIKNCSLHDLLPRWNSVFILLITSGAQSQKVGKELFSLFFKGKKASELIKWKDILVYFDLYLEEGNELLEMLKKEPLEEIKPWKDFLNRLVKYAEFSELALSVFLDNDAFKVDDLRYWHDTIKTALHYSNVKNNSLKFISLFSNFSLDEIGLYQSVDIMERCVWNGLAPEVVPLLNKFNLEDLYARKFRNLLQLCAERGAAKEVLNLLKSKIKSFDEAKDWSDILKISILNSGLFSRTKKK